MNPRACAITGHRPIRFCFGYNENLPLCKKIKECLFEQFKMLHDKESVGTFFVGGALGVDMWAGEELLTLKEKVGYEDIEIIVVLPFIVMIPNGQSKAKKAEKFDSKSDRLYHRFSGR